MNIVGCEHFVSHIALVEIDVRPLSALRFVARNGIAELYLHGVEVFVFAQLLHTIGFSGHVGIVFHYTLKQFVVLFVCQCRGFRRECVEHNNRI